MFTLDSVQWNIPCDIDRTAEVTASEISGMMLDRSYFNDVLGTWMRYSVRLAVPADQAEAYADLYEALASPYESHTVTLPYNGTTVTLVGRIEVVSDGSIRVNGGHHWRDTTFDIIANHPTKTMSLAGVITRGMSPWPVTVEPTIGETYMYSEDGWIPYEMYPDADGVYY